MNFELIYQNVQKNLSPFGHLKLKIIMLNEAKRGCGRDHFLLPQQLQGEREPKLNFFVAVLRPRNFLRPS